MKENVSKNTKWKHRHPVMWHFLLLIVIGLIAWILGQMAGPELMKAIFL